MPLVEPGRERVGPGQHHVDVDMAGLFHGFEFRGQFGGRRLGEDEARHGVRLGLAIGLERLLGQREIAGHIRDS